MTRISVQYKNRKRAQDGTNWTGVTQSFCDINTFITMGFSFLCCLLLALLLTFSWNEVSDANAITQLYRRDDIIKKSALQTRQQNCQSLFNNYPRDCNATLLTVFRNNIVNILSQYKNNLTDLNILYRDVCVPRCVDPLLRFYQCLNQPAIVYNYIETLTKQGICGTHNGNFCVVVYLNNYASNPLYLDQLTEVCPFPLSASNCASANATCKTYVSGFISNMGCCSIPIIGDVRSCYNNVDEPCQYASSPAITSPAFWCLLLAVIAALFY